MTIAIGLIIGVLLVIAVMLTWVLTRTLRSGTGRGAASGVDVASIGYSPSFSERPIEEVERSLERLIVEGRIRVEAATAEDRAKARIPAYAGPVFRALARRYRVVTLVDADVAIHLHEGTPAEDALGGWRLAAAPDEIDIRLAPFSESDGPGTGDCVLDATWSPRSGTEVAVHSTIVHLLVRAVLGDKT